MSLDPRVRFAPSPTGYLHVGGARTALFNFLFARHHGGQFILRIEDTDRTRYQPSALEEIVAGLRWLGLEWDEGPDKPGGSGPYVQSERIKIYQQKAVELIQQNYAYRCFCTPERLEALRKENPGSGYDRHCRNLSPSESGKKQEDGIPHVIRLKIPDNRDIRFEDAIRGVIEYRSDVLNDAVILKSDGFPTYHLANVVDDHLMGITHVMRGDEWIASTPRHILLYEAFGWQRPVFAHMPIILAADGGKLSKRKGAASVLDYQRAGFLPDALRNFLVLLGWSPGDDREILSLDEMVEAFSIEKISAKAAVFDEQKLEWVNGHYLRHTPGGALLEPVRKAWMRDGIISAEDEFSETFLFRVIELMKERAKRLGDISSQSAYFFRQPSSYLEKAARKHFKPEAAARLRTLMEKIKAVDDFRAQAIETLYRSTAAELNIGAGKLIHPTRLALSGVDFGPGLFEMMELLGRGTVLERLERAIHWIEKQSPDNKRGENE